MANRTDTGKFKPGISGNPKGRPPKALRADAPSVSVSARLDEWYSAATGIGTTRDKRLSVIHSTTPVSIQEAEDLWRGDDLAARIVEVWPNEMLREGFEVALASTDDDDDGEDITKKSDARSRLARRDATDARSHELVEQVEQAWEDLHLTESLWRALAYERAYGGAAILIGANDGQADPRQPLNVDRVSKVTYLTALEPRECVPMTWYTDPAAPKYGEPATYMLNPLGIGTAIEGTIKASLLGTEVHESRMLIFPGIRTSRVQRASTALSYGWGDSVLTRAQPVLRDFSSAMASAGVLVSDFAQGVLTVENLVAMLSAENADAFRLRIEMMDYARSSLRAILLDKSETFERKTTPVSGLPELLDRFMTRLAAAADMPLTLLFGQSPAGLNATGASDIRFFYDRVAAAQRRKLAPQLRYVTRIIMSALGGEAEKWSIRFRPLWQPTEKETAEAREIQMRTDTGYIAAGVVESSEIAVARFGGAEYSFETQIDLDERAAFEPTGEAPDDIRDPNAPLEPTDPNADPSAPAAPAPVDIAKTAMNGAQITSLMDVVARVGAGEISRPSGQAILRIAFQLSDAEATEVLGPENFEPTKPEPPPPFGGGGAPPFGGGGPKPPTPPAKPDDKEPPPPNAKLPELKTDWSPDQPRAEDGKFGEGGGSSSGGSGGAESAARAEYGKATAAEEAAGDALDAAEDEHDQALAEVQDLKSELGDARGGVKEAARDVKRATDDDERAAAEQDLKEAKERAAELEKSIERATAKITAAKERVAAARAAKRAASKAVDKASREIDKARGEDDDEHEDD